MKTKSCACGCRQHIDRRRALTALAGAGFAAAIPRPTVARAEAVLAPLEAQDEGFMRLALAQAAKGDFPFGAVIVRRGDVAATGRNMGVETNDPTAHGEMVAIRAFVARHSASEFKDATLYTTGEPCPMCMGAILWCGFRRLVYGASIAELATRSGQITLTSAEVARQAPFAHIDITGGVLAKEALTLFR